MRIATWNINGLRARLPFILHWLNARKPDVVGLQELKMIDDKFPHDAFAEVGYQAVTHGQKSWNGVAILSRTPAEVTQTGLPGEEEFGSRLITATVEGLSFTTIYVPNGKTIDHADYGRKLQWLESLADHLKTAKPSGQPTVLCGDFNVCPLGIDSWNEEMMFESIFHTEAERKRIGALIDCGFTDLYRAKFPETQEFSWWDYRGGAFHRKQGLRIDFLLGTPAIVDRLRSVEIDREYRKKQDDMTASDHAPVIADLD